MKIISSFILSVTCISSSLLVCAGNITDIVGTPQLKKVLDENPYVIAKFSSESCGPCKRMKPIFIELSQKPEFSGVKFIHIDTDKNDAIANTYEISAIPTFIYFVNGIKVSSHSGGTSKEAIEVNLRKYFNLTAAEPKKVEKNIAEQSQKKTTEHQAATQEGWWDQIVRSFHAFKDYIASFFSRS